MVLSRTQARSAFNYVMDTVLERDDSSLVKQSLVSETIGDITALCSTDRASIMALTYPNPAGGRPLPIPKGDRNILLAFQYYVKYRADNGSTIQDGDWGSITIEDFDAFRISTEFARYSNQATLPNPSLPTSSTTTTRLTYTPADLFRKGIKRDPLAFPTLKDERFNDTWHRSFANQARAQNVMNILDSTYVPSTAEEIELFDEQQKYVYAILEQKVLTDRGKSIVRAYEKTYDAQKVFKMLADHHLKSTKAMIDSSAILSYITSSRLGNGQWKGTTEGYIVNWQDQVRLYERQVPTTDHFSDGQKRTMLENSVSSITELRQVKNNADLEKTKSGKSLSYEQYMNLLLSAASAYDEEYKPKLHKRSAFQHEIEYVDDNDYEHFDIDSHVQTIQTNVHDRQNRRPRLRSPANSASRVRMPMERWSKLSRDDRKIWDTLSDTSKATILGTLVPKSPAVHQVNLHDISAYDYIQANLHELNTEDEMDDAGASTNADEEFHDAVDTPDLNSGDDTLLVNNATTGKPLQPGDIRRIMSTASKHFNSKKTTLGANVCQIEYRVSNHTLKKAVASLVDRGSNGGVAGSDTRVISKSHRTVDIQGIDNHRLNDISIGTVGGTTNTHRGHVILIFNQYAIFGQGTTIHSPAQFEHYGCDVNDKSVHVGGLQRIKTPDGYVIPLEVVNGLPRMSLRPYTDQEWDTLPHVFMTHDLKWDPSVLDYQLDDKDDWHDAVTHLEVDPHFNLFDEFGNYRHRVNVQFAEYLQRPSSDPMDDIIDQCVYSAHKHEFQPWEYSYDDQQSYFSAYAHESDIRDDQAEQPQQSNKEPRTSTTRETDYGKLRPMFGWLSADIIKKTFQATTQYARLPSVERLRRVFKSNNPALNVHRRDEAVACDFIYSDTPAVDNGATSAVVFAGMRSNVLDLYSVKTDKQFVNTLEDNIRERGAPNKLISDRAQVEISEKVHGILRTFFIGAWQSEPHQQQQNPAERRIQSLKDSCNRIMDRTGAPAYTWLLCLLYVCYLLNHTYNATVNGVPMNHLTGTTVDISPLLRFHYWQKVYYKLEENDFPSDSREGTGHIVGISEHVGPMMTWKVLNCSTKKVIHRSQIRPYDSQSANLRADFLGGEKESPSVPIVNLGSDAKRTKKTDGSLDEGTWEPAFNPQDLVGRSFLMDPEEDGQRHRATITRLVENHEDKTLNAAERIKFFCSISGEEAEQLITYNQMLDYITKDEDNHDIAWKFKKIVSHQGPLEASHKDYMGSSYNVMVEWENGEITTEPLSTIAADDPVTCAIYARENNLLQLSGWKRFKALAKREKKFLRLVNQAKLRSYRTTPKYKYGYEVPRNYNHAKRLDEINKSTRWGDAIKTELDQIDDYDTFEDCGHNSKAKAPSGYKRIRVHFIFDVKHDGRHRARLVADGHLTEVPVESVYSGVVSLRGFRLVVFLAELNGMETWATDVTCAYLEAYTTEKVYIEAGPEFGDALQGHILIVRKALYGLRRSGQCWHNKLADCLLNEGFKPCKAEPDIWMRPAGDHYEYIAVYVDDIAFVMESPNEFIDVLQDKYKFKLKGSGPISFHLGMDFHRDKDGVLCIAPSKYIERMIASYERMFGQQPKQTVTSPLEKGDHPEIDTSELLDEEGIKQYQSLIGALQWVVTIGRIDVTTAVMTLSGFRAAPRKGHMDRVKRIYGYLAKMRHAKIRIRTDEPDYSDLPDFDYDWAKSVYGELSEVLPQDAPTPLGKPVTLSHFVDANLMHDMLTGRSVTGILHMVNKTPMDWFSKKQATVETATYGSEFCAARTCVEQIIDLRNTLRYLGVKIRTKSYMFGDNESVVNSSMQVHAKLHKRHNMLSFHRVREAIAAKMVVFHHIPGAINPADILSKHWGYGQVWTQLKAMLFWQGDTALIEEQDVFPSAKRGVTKSERD